MSRINLNILTSQNINCGIADTTEQLINELEKCGNIEINVIPIGNTDTKNPWHFIKLLSGIEDDQITHIQYQPDLFGHLPVPILEVNFLPLIITILKQRRNKIVTTLHEVGLNSRINRLILKFLNSSDRLIVHNRNMIEILKKNGINENKIVEIPLGSSEPQILDKNECKSKLEVSGKKIITVFGFVSPNKGHDLLIDILPELDKDTILFVAGGARNEDQEIYKKSLESKVLSLGLEDRVKFFNFVDKNDLPVIASATDLFVYPYKWIVASAALSLGLSYRVPTISSDLSYFKEIQDKYDCIELFETGNKQDLLVKIKQLQEDHDRQAYLKKKCEEFYYETSWKSVARKTNAIYSELDMN
jgi:glycosyltransferase involved in cell wall biosynthesis